MVQRDFKFGRFRLGHLNRLRICLRATRKEEVFVPIVHRFELAMLDFSQMCP